mmetsp:Transcript_25830/g.55579  ORF Transcript_25830/g.55579 Transcript_25830/m.55579 type:complete len:317 (-) Transcript_25830:713-1663(-)
MVQNAMKQIKVIIGNGSLATVPNLLVRFPARGTDAHHDGCFANVEHTDSQICGRGQALLEECLVERLATMWFARVHLITSGHQGVVGSEVGVPRDIPLLELGKLGGMVTVFIIRQDPSHLAKLFGSHFSIIIQTRSICPQVIIAIVSSPTRIEINFHLGHLARKCRSIKHHFPILCQIHLSTITSCRDGHLIHAAAHGHAWNVLDISTLMHVIVHAHKEQIIANVPTDAIVLVVGPCKAVAVDTSLAIVAISREDDEAIVGIQASGTIALGQVGKAQIGIIGGGLVDTVYIVGRGTVTVAIIGLTILRPAAHGRMT